MNLLNKKLQRKNLLIGGCVLVVLIIFGLISSSQYSGFIKTQVAFVNKTPLPDICYDKTTKAVSYVCSIPTAASAFVGAVWSSLGHAETEPIIDDSVHPGGEGNGPYDGPSIDVYAFSAPCAGYCDCKISTSPVRPNSCPANDLHTFSPKAAPTCQYMFRGKVQDGLTTILLRHYFVTGKFAYSFIDRNGTFTKVPVASEAAFVRDRTLTRKAQQQCAYESAIAATGTASTNCGSICSRYIPTNLEGVKEEGSCTTKTLKNPLPVDCAAPTPTPRPTATVTPRPTATPTPRPTATVTPIPTACTNLGGTCRSQCPGVYMIDQGCPLATSLCCVTP